MAARASSSLMQIAVAEQMTTSTVQRRAVAAHPAAVADITASQNDDRRGHAAHLDFDLPMSTP
ncbi:hypothetical protein BH93_27105 (plasmid) [Rhodococcoides fascians A25f]|uniref:hypothetical protein n=1 Tax=Rhodococcoides fascians TaxID=1828 RepID=UPI0012D33D20|nr:hypothetical protein [Rhodococcus fascians]QII09245.1 hypothetical protein BH93_27105 [Rhodococcus fascians A25f]